MYTKNEYILQYPNYTDTDDFKESLIHGREVEIEWKNVCYVMEHEPDGTFSFCEGNKPQTERIFKTVDEMLLNVKIGDDLLSDIITKAEVMWRNI